MPALSFRILSSAFWITMAGDRGDLKSGLVVFLGDKERNPLLKTSRAGVKPTS